MGRKVYEVTGYAPTTEGSTDGFLICVSCHREYQHPPDACECHPVTLGDETEGAQSCDECGETIETTNIGADPMPKEYAEP